jgi:cystathionine beta-lyase
MSVKQPVANSNAPCPSHTSHASLSGWSSLTKDPPLLPAGPMKKLSPPEFARLNAKTRLNLAGRDPTDSYGFVNPAIVRGSTVVYPNTEDFLIRKARYTYGTEGNPTIDALLAAANTIEGGAGVVVTPSGLMACTLAFLAVLSSGDHVLVTDSVYRPTRNFCETFLKRMGVETTYYDPAIGADIATLFKPNTKAVWTEAPGSQTFEMQDIPAIVAAAHARDVLVLMDNTWATPLFFDSHKFGVDLSVQAGTKYYAGHSDVLIGTVSARTPELYKSLRQAWHELGLIIAPEDAFLTLRGMRTMALRLKEQMPAGIEMAQWLSQRPEVASVLHPALPGAPGHEIWKRDFTGASSLFAIELAPVSMKAVGAMLDGLTLFGIGASWGGYESLVLPFDCKPYRTATTPNFKGPTVRIHIGLEDLEDLKADLDAGFARLRAAS